MIKKKSKTLRKKGRKQQGREGVEDGREGVEGGKELRKEGRGPDRTFSFEKEQEQFFSLSQGGK